MDYDIGTNEHVPIDIAKIIDIHVNDKNNKQFTIQYKKPAAAGATVQVYELDTIKECNEFVGKVKYFECYIYHSKL